MDFTLSGRTGVPPLIVEPGAIRYAGLQVMSDEAQGDELQVIAKGVVEIERSLPRRAGSRDLRRAHALCFETALPTEEPSRCSHERDVGVHDRLRSGLPFGILEEVEP